MKKSVDEKQLVICRVRGHEWHSSAGKWAPCKWCGLWRREVVTVEESRTRPPEAQIDNWHKLESQIMPHLTEQVESAKRAVTKLQAKGKKARD